MIKMRTWHSANSVKIPSSVPVSCSSGKHVKVEDKERVIAWQQGQKDRAKWKHYFDMSVKYTSQGHAGQAVDPKQHTPLGSTCKHLLPERCH